MARRQDILARLGARVRDLRKRKGFSQEMLAARCELDRTYIGGIERGERNVAVRNIERIAEALDMTISELLEDL